MSNPLPFVYHQSASWFSSESMSTSSMSCRDADYAQDTLDDQHAFGLLLQKQGRTVRGIVALADLVKLNRFRCLLLSRMAVGLESLTKELQDRIDFNAKQKEEENAMSQQLADFYYEFHGITTDGNIPEPVPSTNHSKRREQESDSGPLLEGKEGCQLLTDTVQEGHHHDDEASSTSRHEHLITGAQTALKNCLVIILQWQCIPLEDLEVRASEKNVPVV
jgi:hypothetical protein